MVEFNTELKTEQLDDFIHRLNFYGDDLVGLKAETIQHYKNVMHKSPSMTSKIVSELNAMWGSKNPAYAGYSTGLQEIGRFYAKNFSCKFPLEMHRAALIIAFPLVREIVSIANEYGENTYTPALIIEKLKGDYGSKETVEQAVPKALRTMCNLGMIRRVNHGIYKNNTWPVFNTCGLLATMTVAQAFTKEGNVNKNLAIKGLSFELTKEFTDCFAEINYEAIVGEQLWQNFNQSAPEFTLQYDGKAWTLSDKPFKYAGVNATLSKIPKHLQLNVKDAIGIKRRSKK